MHRQMIPIYFAVLSSLACPLTYAQNSTSDASIIGKLDSILKRLEAIEQRLTKLEIAVLGRSTSGQPLSEKHSKASNRNGGNPAAETKRNPGETNWVRGLVTLDGMPIQARVLFVPQDGTSPLVAETNDEGRYVIPVSRSRAATNQKYKVEISTAMYRQPVLAVEYPRERVPAKYNSKSQIVVKISSGNNTIDFELTTK